MPPNFLFDRFLPVMPRMREFLGKAQFGVLRTIDPPITVPAWAVFFTGVDPGTLGIYGFRHRRAGSYNDTYTPTPQMIPVPPVWETLSRSGRRVAVIGMPPGYPPPTVNGVYVSDFLTPEKARDFATPISRVPELEQAAGGSYRFDITFRAEDRERIATELFDMTRRRWAMARHLWAQEKWDLFALHEIGPDRLHHAFWKYIDPAHPKYEEHPVFSGLADRYYSMLDQEIGQLLDHVGDEVTVLFASDHGSQAMDGCFCINEWLADNGYLTLRGARPPAGTQIEKASVDWSKTKVWGAGGYYARLFFNIQGREPEGTVPPMDVPELTRTLTEQLSQVRREDGRPLNPIVRDPRTIYRQLRGDPPDLMVYFGDLRCRSAGTLGYGKWFISDNDTGPDDSVHTFEGIYAVAGGGVAPRGPSPERSILDVSSTLLTMLEQPVPTHNQGRPITDWI
ncbi:MAG: alkaline phosphatase family protein [Thermoplasmata archaeon]|nr:alkaline phosphatase family protein [Thermoplasmata archaeon]